MKKLLTVLVFLFLGLSAHAQLGPGSIVFIGFNADGTDGVAFLVLDLIPSGTVIYFTDNEYQSGTNTFNTNESYWTWTAGSDVLPGTVVIISDVNQGFLNGSSPNPTASTGSVVWATTTAPDNNSGLASDGESVYAYLGNSYSAPTTFLGSITTDGYSGGSNGTGLNGTNSKNLGGNIDIGAYNGSTVCNGTKAQCITMIINGSWITDDGSGDQSNNGFDAEFPGSVATSFSGSAFPVELTVFSGRFLQSAVLLQWRTASETDNAYFVVEHSTDARTFSPIGKIQGAGTSRVEKLYAFEDKTPAAGRNYYRLRQVDLNGGYTFSYVITLVAAAPSDVRLYPSPASDVLNVELEKAPVEETGWQIYDLNGRLALNGILSAETDKLRIPVANLQDGMYTLRFSLNGDMQSLLFVKGR